MIGFSLRTSGQKPLDTHYAFHLSYQPLLHRLGAPLSLREIPDRRANFTVRMEVVPLAAGVPDISRMTVIYVVTEAVEHDRAGKPVGFLSDLLPKAGSLEPTLRGLRSLFCTNAELTLFRLGLSH